MFCTPLVIEDPLHKLEHRVTKDTFLADIERLKAMPAAVTMEVDDDSDGHTLL